MFLSSGTPNTVETLQISRNWQVDLWYDLSTYAGSTSALDIHRTWRISAQCRWLWREHFFKLLLFQLLTVQLLMFMSYSSSCICQSLSVGQRVVTYPDESLCFVRHWTDVELLHCAISTVRLVRLPHEAQMQTDKLQEKTADSKFVSVLDAVNTLGACAWTINKQVSVQWVFLSLYY